MIITAPSPPSYQAPIIPVQPQNEEKTLVYVLVKKPEEQQEIVIPTAAPTQPSKPEVYFIKYKTQKESGGGGYAAAGNPSGGSFGSSGGSFGNSGASFGSSGSSFGSSGASFGSSSSSGLDLSAPGPIGGGR